MTASASTEVRPFLRARWESLLMLNWACPAEWLAGRVPPGVELDPFEGECLVSIVGFLFKDTRVRGVRIPWHVDFEEVNLRFYVRRVMPDGEVRRAVTFVSELVPRRAIATVARLAYNEPYRTVPMSHSVALDPERGGAASYRWRFRGAPFALQAAAEGPARESAPGSEAEFITEHYWGYTKTRSGGTSEYPVEHPRWRVWDVPDATLDGDTSALYGPDFGALLATPPRSAFLAEGSAVEVFPGSRIA